MNSKRLVMFLVTASFISLPAAYGFWSWFVYNVHKDLTNAAIGSEFLDKKTLGRLHEQNSKVDLGNKYSQHALHFDSEAFAAGCSILAHNLNASMDYLAICDKPRALEKLGEALHAVQDFYSHSNWVENHLFNRASVLPADIPIYTNLVTLRPDGVFVPGSLVENLAFQDTCTPNPPITPANTIVSGYDPQQWNNYRE